MQKRMPLTPMLAALCAAAGLFAGVHAQAQDGAVKPVFESDKSWKFDKQKMLSFGNESPNRDGARFLRWEGYTWVVSENAIVCVDPRPYGTTVQGARFQKDADGKAISDKDLMKDLKKQANDIRKAKDPNERDSGPNVDIGVGIGFRF